MAMTKCKECGKEVSQKAPTCPHCGVKDPGDNAKQTAMGCLVVIILFGCFFAYCSRPDSPEDIAKKAAAAEQCRKELKCWAEKNLPSAAAYCDDVIEKHAKYSHEWTNGTLEMIFSRYKWKNEETGEVTYIGDKIKFQNGFGAWQNMMYSCDFEPKSSTVISVQVSEGRLP